jgi:hypothetical protein
MICKKNILQFVGLKDASFLFFFIFAYFMFCGHEVNVSSYENVSFTSKSNERPMKYV